MKRVIVLVILAAMLTDFPLLNVTDASASIADTSIPDNDVTSSLGEANNSSVSVTITITMYTVPEE